MFTFTFYILHFTHTVTPHLRAHTHFATTFALPSASAAPRSYALPTCLRSAPRTLVRFATYLVTRHARLPPHAPATPVPHTDIVRTGSRILRTHRTRTTHCSSTFTHTHRATFYTAPHLPLHTDTCHHRLHIRTAYRTRFCAPAAFRLPHHACTHGCLPAAHALLLHCIFTPAFSTAPPRCCGLYNAHCALRCTQRARACLPVSVRLRFLYAGRHAVQRAV